MRDWTPSALLQISGSYWECCAIHAAVALDIFSSLAEGPLTVAELAGRIGGDPRATGMLATALCALGFLSRRGEVCTLEPFARWNPLPANGCAVILPTIWGILLRIIGISCRGGSSWTRPYGRGMPCAAHQRTPKI